MMVTFVSQCEKKALNRTRRVLDAFANRIGSNTWQTVITNEGLNAVKKLLRRTASKNTAVSCFWIRSRSRSELVWLVGDRSKFNNDGVVPVNLTKRNLLYSNIENDWKYLPLIKALVALAALLHDWGKASQLFQDKLNPKNKKNFKGDPIRHEWISCLLLNALVQTVKDSESINNDAAWLGALTNGAIDEAKIQFIVKNNQNNPLADLPPIAKLVAWLVVSHHRLPLNDNVCMRSESAEGIEDVLRKITQQWGYQNRYDENEYQERVQQCFQFPQGLLSSSKPWLSQIKKWSARLLQCESQATQALQDSSYRLVLSHARLCLMLGDHCYSSQESNKHWQSNTELYANTDFKTKKLKQKLDEHLVGVAACGLKNAHLLPAFECEPPVAKDITALKKLSPRAYQWQDKAVKEIKTWQKSNQEKHGFFAVNMASTGCGKTFANAKIMQALSKDGSSLRFILALGLRTLTLQTGDEYRERVGLDNSDLAVLIGSYAVMELHQQKMQDEKDESNERSGSLSQETLLDEDVDYDCAIPEEGLVTVLSNDRDKKFLYAPVLACTIDHLMAATQTKRGGRYILPTLRLMSSDLVIDEIDDFSGDDLVAIGRLIHFAGMLGRKVMISSATIPPDLAEGYFKAYRDGWQLYCKTRNSSPVVGCAWVDEFTTQVTTNRGLEIPEAIIGYRDDHKRFISQRVSKLLKQPVKRKADIESCESLFDRFPNDHNDEDVIQNKQQAYFELMAKSVFKKHQQHHTIDNTSQLSVSFGVVRVANISPCVALSQYLLSVQCKADTTVRVMTYHSQQVLLLRHLQEQHLDKVLKRKESKDEEPKAFLNADIRKHLDSIIEKDPQIKNVIFILVATPVEEVGRDHDFDWAVVEPSSYRSIIQLAGRVRRHRDSVVKQANMSLMQYNWRGVKCKHRECVKAFIRPGFEDKVLLTSHDLNDLVDTKQLAKQVNAIPRIQKPDKLQETKKLVDLEHYAIRSLLATNPKGCFIPATLQGYLSSAWFLTAYPQKITPFRGGPPSLKIFLTFNDDKQAYFFCEKNEKGIPINREKSLNIVRADLKALDVSRLWLQRDFNEAVDHEAVKRDLSYRRVSLRYGELSFPHNESMAYEYSDQFGLVKR